MKQASIYFMICCAACLGVGGIVLSAEKDDGSTYTKVGQQTPEFEFTTLDGKVLKSTELKGKVVVINFFATWCGPCRSELPHLKAEVWDRFKDDPNFVLVVAGREHTRQELETFKKNENFAMPLAPDVGRKVYSRFAEKWIPRNYVIGSDGRIAFQSKGYDAAEFERMIKTIDASLKKAATS